MRTRLVPVTNIVQSLQESWADSSRKPFVNEIGAYIPVKAGYDWSHIIAERSRIGRGYQKLGDVIVFHGRKPDSEDIKDVLQRESPRGILWISGCEGDLRIPKIELIYGSGGEVIHRESGIRYLLDIQQVMFSQGNREEKSRIASFIRKGERVCDMFAGIGYFSLGMGKAGAYVHAIEINPVSFKYLEHNVRLNGLSHSIQSSLGDCRDKMSGLYDRIHMGHFDAISFLNIALSHSKPGTVLHVHMLNDQSSEINRILHSCGLDSDINIQKVKKTGPGVWHMVCDLVIQ